ncbi:MAG: CBS domain-containing protein [Balneolaceae bacterium]
MVINLINEQVKTVPLNTTIDRLFEEFHRSNQHIFPVVDSSRLLGVLSRKEL